MGLVGSKSNKNWLIDIVEDMDVEDLEKGIWKLGAALLEVRQQVIDELANPTSQLSNTLEVNLTNALCALQKKHNHPEEKKKLKETYPDYKSALPDAKRLAQAMKEAHTETFFPIEMETWMERTAPIWKDHFAKLEMDTPETVTKAVKRCNKSIILEAFYRVKLKAGVDVFATNKTGNTAMILAVKKVKEMAESIAAEAEKAGGPAEDDGTVARWERACRNLVRLLGMAGAVENPRIESDATCGFGWTALIWAACMNRLDMMEILCETTADIDYKDRFGRTALYFAADQGNLEAVKFLVEKGADKDIINSFGERAITRAQKLEHAEIVEVLGGDIELQKKFSLFNRTMSKLACETHG